jgi:hypothetical protein
VEVDGEKVLNETNDTRTLSEGNNEIVVNNFRKVPTDVITMYSTKTFNPKVAESYLNIGDPYSKQSSRDPRYIGKQFQTNPSKLGQTEGYFGKFTHTADVYSDTNGYRTTQERDKRKLGFGSHDARRRDEFTLDIRAKQYRELLSKEKEFERLRQIGHAYDEKESTVEDKKSIDPKYFQTQIPTELFDIGRTPQGTTPTCTKCSRDTFYCTHRAALQQTNTLRRDGDYKTTMMAYGASAAKPDTMTKVTHQVTTRGIKEFYDNNHLSVGRN